MSNEAIYPMPPGGPSMSPFPLVNLNRTGRWDTFKRNVGYYASPLFNTSNMKKTVNLWAAVILAGTSIFNANADEFLFIAAVHACNAKIAGISVDLAKVTNLITAGFCFKNLTPALLPFELGLLGYNTRTLT
jgi:hypothetical protein